MLAAVPVDERVRRHRLAGAQHPVGDATAAAAHDIEARDGLQRALADQGIDTSIHFRALHLHPYYEQTFGWQPEHLPIASRVWQQLVSLPLFPDMREEEFQHRAAGGEVPRGR